MQFSPATFVSYWKKTWLISNIAKGLLMTTSLHAASRIIYFKSINARTNVETTMYLAHQVKKLLVHCSFCHSIFSFINSGIIFTYLVNLITMFRFSISWSCCSSELSLYGNCFLVYKLPMISIIGPYRVKKC